MSSLKATRKLKAVSPSCDAGIAWKLAVSADPCGATTVTVAPCSLNRPPASVTRRVNVSIASSVSPLGAANVVTAAVGADSVTVAPPVCVHAYCSVSPASGSWPEPVRVTVAPSSTPVWSAPAFAVGASLRLESDTLMAAVASAVPSLTCTVRSYVPSPPASSGPS